EARCVLSRRPQLKRVLGRPEANGTPMAVADDRPPDGWKVPELFADEVSPDRELQVVRNARGTAQLLTDSQARAAFSSKLVGTLLKRLDPAECEALDLDWLEHPVNANRRKPIEWWECHHPDRVKDLVSLLRREIAAQRPGMQWEDKVVAARDASTGSLLMFADQLIIDQGPDRVSMNVRDGVVTRWRGPEQLDWHQLQPGERVEGTWLSGRPAVLRVEEHRNPLDVQDDMLTGMLAVCRLSARRRVVVLKSRGGPTRSIWTPPSREKCSR